MSVLVSAPISVGELLDKITILEIKAARIDDPAKLANVRAEQAELAAVLAAGVPDGPCLDALRADLAGVNRDLWEIEDAIRECERRQDFGPRFIALARSVYRANDQRAEIKRNINALTGSRLIEEKSYRAY